MQAPSSGAQPREHGVFFDGRTARPRGMTVNVMSEGIQIYGERARSLGYWGFDGLLRASGTDFQPGLNLMHRDHPDARLVITDPGIIGQLANMAPGLGKHRETRRGAAYILLQIAALMGIIAALIFVVVPKTARVIASAIPVEWETAWGKSIQKKFTANLKVCRGKAGTAALNTLTTKLFRTGPVRASKYRIAVTVVKVENQNAFATMGGQIVVFSKLIERMGGPDELAGVLAHEIAHVIARHPLTHAVESITTTAFTGNFGGGSSSDIGGALALSAYSRAKENEADRIAEQILSESEISTQGLAQFFQRLQKSGEGGPGGALALFNSHPALAARAAMLEDQGSAPMNPALSPAQWQALQNICR